MTKKEFQDLEEHLKTHFSPPPVLFRDPDYRTAIAGYCGRTGRVIYDYGKCIDYLMEDGSDFESASDFFHSNTERSLDYIISSLKPIIMYTEVA